MAHTVTPALVGQSAASNRAPAVEVAVCAPIARLKRLRREFGRPVDDVAGVVEIPVAVQQPSSIVAAWTLRCGPRQTSEAIRQHV
jgi:hypothetical protein